MTGPNFLDSLAPTGETGALMRSIDWSNHELGPPDRWPSSLKTVLSVMAYSRHPMFLFWGPELFQFYNDAYLPSFGVGKHPQAMGQRGADCWQEIWPIIHPQIEDALLRRIASWNVDQLVPIYRNGQIEEVYWTYGYSPVLSDDLGVAGVLVVCTETTPRVLAERRLATLQRLSTALAARDDAYEAVAAAGEVLSQDGNPDVAFVRLFSSRGLGTIGVDDDLAQALRGHLRQMSEPGGLVPLPPELDRSALPALGEVDSVFVANLGDPARPRGIMVLGLSPALPHDDSYLEFAANVAARISLSMSRIEALRIRTRVRMERDNLLMQAPVAAAVLTGPEQTFTLANPAYVEMVGGREVLGKTYLEAFPEIAGTPIATALADVYRTGVGYTESELRVDLPGYPERYFSFAVQPIRDDVGEVEAMMVLASDITDAVQSRLHLEVHHAEREELMRELTAANRAKDDFLAMLGHELRNPLAPIVTALHLIRQRHDGDSTPELAVLERQVRHMTGLVDDLLDISRITRGVMELTRERVPMAAVAARAVEQVQPLVDQRGHTLRVDVPEALCVEGDARRLAQVLANLLINSARYTPPGGEIRLIADEDAGQVRVRVIDNGRGIAPEVLPRLFEAFARVGVPREQTGLGLGLAIVRSLVQAHDGSVELASPGLGQGTTATVRLPRSAGASPEAQASEPGEAGGPLRLLVVDDNKDAADLLSLALGMQGHEVRVALSPSEALGLADGFVPDVAILDLGLPEIDGFELRERLSTTPGWSGVSFAALTGFGQQSDIARSREAGFAEHFVKPVDLGHLAQRLRELAAPGSQA